MVNKPKQIGTAVETAIVRTCIANGFEKAHRLVLSGANDQGDIELTEGIIIEAKGGKAAETASDNQIAKWLQETAREVVNHRSAELGFLVTKKAGVGAGNAHLWPAYFTHTSWAQLLGYTLPAGVDGDAIIRTSLGSVLAVVKARATL